MRPKNAQAVLRSANLSAFLVSNLTNIQYLTGLKMSAGLVLVRGKNIMLFVDGRYEEAARRDGRQGKQGSYGISVKSIEEFEKVMSKVARCGFESDDVTVARVSGWKKKFKKTKFVANKGVIEEFRRSKDSEEIKKFKKAQRITRKIMKKIPAHLKVGITERGLAEKIRQWAIELGAENLSFDSIVAFGKNSALPHHHPGRTKLKKRDVVQIDCGAKVDGYCADQSRVFFKGKPSSHESRVYAAVEKAKKAATASVKPGVSNHKLDMIARDILKQEDLEQYFTHSLGHGVGLDIHEGPSLSKKTKKTKLLKNEIVTIEPGVYMPGKFGMRLEDEVIISDMQPPKQ